MGSSVVAVVLCAGCFLLSPTVALPRWNSAKQISTIGPCIGYGPTLEACAIHPGILMPVVEDIMPEMEEYWPDLLIPSSPKFCVLKNNKIKPSEDHYKLDDRKTAITSVFGAKPKFQCIHPEKGGQVQTLGQIEICVDRDFQLIDCEKSTEEIWSNEIFPQFVSGHSELSVEQRAGQPETSCVTDQY